MGLAIGVDVGGTKVAAGVVTEAGEVVERVRRDTPAQDPDQITQTVIAVIHELAGRHAVVAAGIGAAGWIDRERATVLFAPNLPWRDEPLRQRIAAATDLPLYVDNDGNTAAWAEFTFGAARGATDSMVLCTVGTGIGGGLILAGEVLRGANGMAGELGHIRAVPQGRPCKCGRLGCLEQYASGTALVRFAREAAAAEPDSARLLLRLAGGSVAAVTGPLVTRAALGGDPAALAAFEQVGQWLGPGIADLIQIVDPEVVVIGGGVAEAHELLMGPLTRGFQAAVAQRGRLPIAPVVPAVLGNAAGFIGAADLARRTAERYPAGRHLDNPASAREDAGVTLRA